jgi:hypothetical protein
VATKKRKHATINLYVHCDEAGTDAADDTGMWSSADDELQALTAGHEEDDFGQPRICSRSTSPCGTPPESPTPTDDGDTPKHSPVNWCKQHVTSVLQDAKQQLARVAAASAGSAAQDGTSACKIHGTNQLSTPPLGVNPFIDSDKPGTTSGPLSCSFRAAPRGHAELRADVAFHAAKVREEGATGLRATAGYLESTAWSHTVKPGMRRKVIEWKLQVADNYLILPNTALHLAFNYFDRFLATSRCPPERLQIVATACLWVAGKICANECPQASAAQLGRMIGAPSEEVLAMERELLTGLRHRVTPLTTVDFVALLVPFVSCTAEQRQTLAHYAETISLAMALVYELLRFSPAALGVAAVVCAASLVDGDGLVLCPDEALESELGKLAEVGSDGPLCRQVTVREINLKQLIEVAGPPPR